MNKFKITLGIIWGILLSMQLPAQNFDNLHFGTDYTLDVITWNTEWFPANGQTTVSYVSEIVESLDAEIIAFQEIDSKPQFQNLINSLDNYNGYYISNDQYQSLAYLYHKDKIEILDQYEIFPNDWSEFPRSPLILEFQFEGKKYVIINNHLKCCGDGVLESWNSDDEEGRRYWACKKLDSYIEDHFDNDRVILLGDLNDELTDRDQDNVFSTFLNDQTSYLFTDIAIAEGGSGSWSYPTWPSHLDHIMITNELFGLFNEAASVCEIIKLDHYFSSWNAYENNVSDHRPVGLKLQTKEIGLDEIAENNISVSPNPFMGSFEVITGGKNVDFFKIFNHSGILISESSVKGEKLIIDSSDWSSGLYFIQFFSNQKAVSSQKFLKL